MNNPYALCFKQARLRTTIGSDIDYNKFCCQVSSIMKVISNKDGDLLTQPDITNENDIPVPERLLNLQP